MLLVAPEDDEVSSWFQNMMGRGRGTFLLNPSKLATDLTEGSSAQKLQLLVKNLLNNQQAGVITDNLQELWFAKSRDIKSLVLKNLNLQVKNILYKTFFEPLNTPLPNLVSAGGSFTFPGD